MITIGLCNSMLFTSICSKYYYYYFFLFKNCLRSPEISCLRHKAAIPLLCDNVPMAAAKAIMTICLVPVRTFEARTKRLKMRMSESFQALTDKPVEGNWREKKNFSFWIYFCCKQKGLPGKFSLAPVCSACSAPQWHGCREFLRLKVKQVKHKWSPKNRCDLLPLCRFTVIRFWGAASSWFFEQSKIIFYSCRPSTTKPPHLLDTALRISPAAALCFGPLCVHPGGSVHSQNQTQAGKGQNYHKCTLATVFKSPPKATGTF